MATLHIGPAVMEKTGTVNKEFSFIVMGDVHFGKFYWKYQERRLIVHLSSFQFQWHDIIVSEGHGPLYTHNSNSNRPQGIMGQFHGPPIDQT